MSAIQLLVSVRNATEARAAIAGGADIVDVKDPDRGSLGFAGWDTIGHVCSAIQHESAMVSAALGELREWENRRSSLDVRNLPTLSFAKIGLANAVDDRQPADTDWERRWLAVRRELSQVNRWVAVAYSDFRACEAPAPDHILKAAIRSDCRILLFDTFVKDGRTTFDHLSEDQLQGLVRQSHQAGLKVAIAGQVTANDVRKIASLRPDIVAVRGAVCENQDRRLNVVESEVVRLKAALDAISAHKIVSLRTDA